MQLFLGDLVANYPFDSSPEGKAVSAYSASPDDGTFRSKLSSFCKPETKNITFRFFRLVSKMKQLNFATASRGVSNRIWLSNFRWLAETYAKNHAHMAKNDHPPCDGTAQGAFSNQGNSFTHLNEEQLWKSF